jgi:peptidoglycan-associated lipoprotein
MRSATIHLLVCVLAAAALTAAGCASKKAVFAPTPPAPPSETTPAPSAPPAAEKPQPIGAEGFGEKPLAPVEGPGAQAGANDLAAQVAAALKTIYFSYNSDDLSEAALAALNANATWLSAHPQVKVTIEGHCDERGTIEYNLALGQRRARSVRDQLVRLGVGAGQIDLISYGKERPAEPGHDEAAWAKNRRAEFRPATP